MKPHIPTTLFGWEDGKFERDYLEKLEQNWQKWKGARKKLPGENDKAFVRTQTLQGGDVTISDPT